LVKEYGINDGSQDEFVQSKEGIVLIPKNIKDRLSEMFAKVNSTNIHVEEDFGNIEGNEGR
jgi:hypothetical protein